MYRYVHVMKNGQKDPVIRSPSYSQGEQITTITEDMVAATDKTLQVEPGIYFEIMGKNPDTGESNPSYHLPTHGDAIYVMEIVGGQKVTIAKHEWPLVDVKGDK